VLAPMVTLCRQSVNHAFLPIMSRLQSAGDIPGMLRLNGRANVMVGTLLYPVLALVFVFAEEIVTIVYTSAYVEAAPVMRVYIIGLAALVIDMSGIMMLLREGYFQMRMSLVVLMISIALSWTAAHEVGLAGAAVGSVTAIYLDRLATLRRISRRTDVAMSRLQDWRALLSLVAFAAIAAVCAWEVVSHYFAGSGPFLRLAVGTTTLAAGYGALYWLVGSGGWPRAAQKTAA
jgi:O-antigen/teichoic acid export membrane protein